MAGGAEAATAAYWNTRYVTHGKLYAVVGAAIGVAVVAAAGLLGLHIDAEADARRAISEQVKEVKDSVTEGFREVRADIKELLKARGG